MPTHRRFSLQQRIAAGEVSDAELIELTREAALNSLDRAMQCRKGLQVKLVQRGFPAETVELVLDRLEAVGVLDDAEYAHALVRARSDRGLALKAIRVELSRKGIEAEASAEALSQITDQQQLEAANRIVEKVILRGRGLPDEVIARRGYAALARRGYSNGITTAVIRQAFGDKLHDELDRCGLDPAA